MNMAMHISIIELFIIFVVMVGIYMVAVMVTEHIMDKRYVAKRMEQMVFEAKLHNMINNNRQALPTHEWFDAYR